jgi:hypothetical protein
MHDGKLPLLMNRELGVQEGSVYIRPRVSPCPAMASMFGVE